MNDSELEIWERAAETERLTHVAHQRSGTLAATAPAARLVELTQQVILLRQYLASACQEIRRIRA